MTYVAADGPPDVDAKHAWAPATGSTPPVINNWTADPVTLPYVGLQRISGWRDGADADDNREARTNDDGEIPYPGRLLGKTISYEGTVAAATREALAGQVTGLLNGYGDRSGLGTMTVTPFSSIGGVVWQYQARVLSVQFDPEPEFTAASGQRELLPVIGALGAWRRGYILSLRMTNPRFYTPTLAGTGYL